MRPSADEVIGLIPAAGLSRRLGALPCSKEVYPIQLPAYDENVGSDLSRQVEVACHCVLRGYKQAGIQNVYAVIRDGKWDIPAFLRDGNAVGLNIAYLMMRFPHGVPFTLDQAYPFVRGSRVALGFPDILFKPSSLFHDLCEHQHSSKADVVLALIATDNSHKSDMVETDERGQVQSIVIKPDKTALTMAWMAALWSPVFTEFMHNYISEKASAGSSLAGGPVELHLGEVFRAAMQNGLSVEAVTFPQGSFLDIGTPSDLAKALDGEW